MSSLSIIVSHQNSPGSLVTSPSFSLSLAVMLRHSGLRDRSEVRFLALYSLESPPASLASAAFYLSPQGFLSLTRPTWTTLD